MLNELIVFASLCLAFSSAIQPIQTVTYRQLKNCAVVINTSLQPIDSSTARTYTMCLARCTKLNTCSLLSYSSSSLACILYTTTTYKYLVYTSSSSLQVAQKSVNGAYPNVYMWTIGNSYDPTLTSYWPIVNNSTRDMIACNDFHCAGTPISSTDRFGSPLSAVRVTNSTSPFNYYYAPTDVYFSGAFSFLAWIKVYSCQAWSRVSDHFKSGLLTVVFTLTN